MSDQRPRKPLGSYFRNTSDASAQPAPTSLRKPTGSYLRPPGSEAPPLPVPVPQMLSYGSVILGLDTDTGQAVSVNQLDLCEGTYIVGVPGMGKSHLLEQAVYQQMQLNEAIIVLDPHGDLVNSIIAHMPE